ncbi:MAG: DMT family transporter [Beijerinckiaceae bacterium]
MRAVAQRLWQSPLALLLITGFFLGATFPFGKWAAAAGITPVVWALLIAGGSGLVLFGASILRGHGLPRDRASLTYYAVAALISYTIPNILLFTVIPRVGAGYSGIMFTLSPMVTLVLARVTGTGRTSLLGMLGIGVGFAGALIIALARLQDPQSADPLAILLAFLIPVSLACGNVYRTRAWPPGADPIALAAGSNLAAAVILAVAALIIHGGIPVQPLAQAPGLALAQVTASVLMFTFFFQLQAVGGPVYLSQIGYVAAAVGLITSIVVLGERYGIVTLAGVLVIVAGVTMTTLAQKKT